MPKTIKEQRDEWIERALKSGQCAFDKCRHCGSVRHGCYNILDGVFTCVVCISEERFPDPPRHSLDLEDFSRI